MAEKSLAETSLNQIFQLHVHKFIDWFTTGPILLFISLLLQMLHGQIHLNYFVFLSKYYRFWMKIKVGFRSDHLELDVRIFVLHLEGEVFDVANLEIGTWSPDFSQTTGRR